MGSGSGTSGQVFNEKKPRSILTEGAKKLYAEGKEVVFDRGECSICKRYACICPPNTAK